MSDQTNNVGATPATGPSTGSQDAPLLIFSDEAGNQINEISLAPGEQKKITVVLSDHPEAITQNFLAQWSVYDSNHQLTSGITCVMDADSKKWLNPLCLSTTDESVGGMSGNDLNSARVNNGVWRCMGKNPNGQFWYPRDMYIPPVPVAEFVLMASSDWTDKYATFELDNNVTKFVMTTETGTPAANGTTVTCNYSMKLTVNNANASNVTPPQENGGGQVTPTPQNNDGETVPPQEDNGGATPTPPQNNEPFPNFPNSSTPKLVFGDEAGKPIKEISLAPGEERTIQVILYQHPEVITQAFQADWNMYDSNHEPTTSVTCKKEGNGWIYPLGLSTYSKAEGGMSGNMLQSAEIDISTWRCIGMNSMTNQFWYPRDQFTTPVPVAEFTVMAANDWTDKFVTFELDPNATQFVLASDTAVPTNKRTVAQCDYDMVLTIKNTDPNAVSPAPKENHNDDTTPPSQVDNTPDEPITTFEGKPLVSKVKLDIAIKTRGINQKTLKVKFIYNTFRLKKDANGKFVKEQGRTHVIDEQLYYCPSNPNQIQHDIRSLPLEEGEYLEDASIAMLSYYRLTGVTNWKKCSFTPSNGLLDASSGEIDLIFDGVIFTNKGAYLSKNSPSQIIGELPAPIAEEENKRREEENKRREEQARKAKEEEERKEREERERKEREEKERKEREERDKQRKIEEINEFVNRCPVFSVEDGFASPPKIHQNANDAGVWVRGFRESKKGTWFMIDDNVNNQYIYPGNIILVDRDKKFTQNMVQIPFEASERKPLRLDAKYSSEIPNGSTTLNSFTRADVNNFVSQCLTTFKSSGHDLASNTNWQYESSKRTEGITLGGTIEGIKFSGSAFQSNKTIAVAYLKQEMYTVSVNNEYSYASDLFTDKVDTEKFRRNITINSNDVAAPAIIDAVKYGRIISLWVVQEGNEPASLNVDNYFNVSVNHTNKSTKYFLHVFGGIAGTQSKETDSLEDVQNVLKQFKEVNKEAMETAMPIEYSVRFLRNLTTNVEWKVLPYYKTYLPRIKFRVTENNKGAEMKCAVYMLDYRMIGNQYKYVKTEEDRKGLDYECQCSPKALCIDIKIDIVALGNTDFNVMLPCIPYDMLEPNEKGEWVFEVHISGSTAYNSKNAECIPSLPGAILSTSNQIYMNNPKIIDGPLIKFGKGTDYTEDRILNYYIIWAKGMVSHKKDLRFLYGIDNINQLRPDYD